MKITRALEGEGVENIHWVCMMGIVMGKFPSVSGLGSLRVGRTPLCAGRGRYKINKIWSMRGILEGNNEVGTKTRSMLLGRPVNDSGSCWLEWVPIVNVSRGFGSRISLLEVNIMHRGIISKSASNAIKAVANGVVEQVLAIQAIAIDKVEAKWVCRSGVTWALDNFEYRA